MTGEPDHNLPVFTISEISAAVKRTLEDQFSLVRIRGEISSLTRAGSGHIYYALKDENAAIEAVSWKGQVAKLGLDPEEGMEVIATGRITTYASGGRSKYQIIIDRLELAGEGALLKLLEERRKKLAAEGLFDEENKQDIPYLPDVIGVITSPSGAVIRDILHRLADRFPRRVILWPVVVQGENAAAEIAAAIHGFNAFDGKGKFPRPDVLIAARGGGALEDLMAFNEEVVVRAAADSDIPLISAVGHETDTTLIDFAADLRAPTPTAAAEHAVPVRIDLIEDVAGFEGRLRRAMVRRIETEEKELGGLARGLPNLGRIVEEATQRLDDMAARFAQALGRGAERRAARLAHVSARLQSPLGRIRTAENRLGVEGRALRRATHTLIREKNHRFEHAASFLRSLSYERTLERGFALVTDGSGARIGRAGETEPGMGVAIRFYDDAVGATVSGSPVSRAKKKPKAKSKPNDKQGSLL